MMKTMKQKLNDRRGDFLRTMDEVKRHHDLMWAMVAARSPEDALILRDRIELEKWAINLLGLCGCLNEQ